MIKLVQEPPKRRLRIKNWIHFILFTLIVVLVIITLFIPKGGHSSIEFKPYRVSYGDTYWGIAKELQKKGYKPQADIRDVVHELIQISGIPAHRLKDGDIIYVPDLGGEK